MVSILLVSTYANFLGMHPRNCILPRASRRFTSVVRAVLEDVRNNRSRFVIKGLRGLVEIRNYTSGLSTGIEVNGGLPSCTKRLVGDVRCRCDGC